MNETTNVFKGWISVKDRLPEAGEKILGRNEEGQKWHEDGYDPDEPLGRMIEWKPNRDVVSQ